MLIGLARSKPKGKASPASRVCGNPCLVDWLLDELTAIITLFVQMTLLQIKQQVSKMTVDERRELNAYLLRLRNESEEGQAKLSQRMRSMDEGRKVTMEALESRIAAYDGE